jgi:hypothetical protein
MYSGFVLELSFVIWNLFGICDLLFVIYEIAFLEESAIKQTWDSQISYRKHHSHSG